MIWTLFFFLDMGYGGVTFGPTRYPSKEACEFTKESLKDTYINAIKTIGVCIGTKDDK